ncbi:MAG TPA: DUF362 domain-containing protein [Opitutales bacterium]|nr:DUF362 domain-containing protein [Opitutales bacterium]
MPRALSKTCIALAAFAALISSRVAASFWADDADRNICSGTIFAWHLDDFGDGAYRQGVSWVFTTFEQRTGKKLVPGAQHKVGIKIYTDSGDGMQTPKPLVRAVVAALRARGYALSDIFLVDATESKLRDTGYLAPLSARVGDFSFEGIEVRNLDSNRWWSSTWFYDNPLPVDYTTDTNRRPGIDLAGSSDNRRSYIPAALIEDVDFWINLPVFLDSQAMEVSGCLANATLWNVSNRERFFSSPANAPVAMAEIAAIPEFIGNWALNIVSLEHYQVIGGPVFNSNYMRSDPYLLAGCDPVILDAWAAHRMNAYRVVMGFRPISTPPYAVSFARIVGVGASDAARIMWVTKDGVIPSVLSNPDVLVDPGLNAPRPDSGFYIPPVPLEARKRGGN